MSSADGDPIASSPGPNPRLSRHSSQRVLNATCPPTEEHGVMSTPPPASGSPAPTGTADTQPAETVAPAPTLGAHLPGSPLHDPDEILERFLRWTQEKSLDLYPAQEDALLQLTTGQHVILSTPTGSGKSLVALALHFKACCEGQRSFYTAPTKALVSEKFFEWCDQFGPENVGRCRDHLLHR